MFHLLISLPERKILTSYIFFGLLADLRDLYHLQDNKCLEGFFKILGNFLR